jgi:hypothetical protein
MTASNSRFLLMGLICAVMTSHAVSAGHARAQGAQVSEYIGFKTPSGNIQCALQSGVPEDNVPPSLRCDIAQIDNPRPPPPRTCAQEWGTTFSVSADELIGQRLCVGDSVNAPGNPILAYGAVWQRDGYTCLSEQTGLTCHNARRHGFTLSRSGQKVF